MSRVLIGNLPPGTTIRNIDDFCSPFGRLLYVDVKNQGNFTMACVEYENTRNALNLIRARNGYNYNGYTVQLKPMSDDYSGPFEVRNNSSRQTNLPPSAPSWSNNVSSSNFDNNRGNNYNSNSNISSGGSGGPLDNLDFTQACRIVYQRFISEGFNPQVAREKALDFVTNMQSRNNQGFNSNCDYFNQNQVGGPSSSNNLNNFGGPNNFNDNFNGNGNQNWNGGNQNWGNNQNWNSNQDSYQNSNWGNFNSNNGPSSWNNNGVNNGGGGGGMPFPMQGNNFNNGGWNNGGNNFIPNPGMPGGNMGPQTKPVRNVVDRDTYMKSVIIRKKIEAKITRGISTPRDLKNLQFHTQIIQDYESNLRFQRKLGKKWAIEELQKMQRYKSASGLVQKLSLIPQAKLTVSEKNSLAKNKAIIDEYEKTLKEGAARASAGPVKKVTGAALAAFERKKTQLIKEAKKNYPFDFRLSGAAKRKMRSLLDAGIEMSEAKLLALHSSLVVKELIDLKTAIKKITGGVDKSKQLVPYTGKPGVGGKPKPGAAGKATTNKPGAAKKAAATTKPAAAATKLDPALAKMTKKERDGMRSANRLIFRYESNNTDVESLTDRDIVLLRMSLKRLQTFNEKYGTALRKTKFDVLLSEKYDKVGIKKDGEAAEENKDENAKEGDDDNAEGGEEAGDDQCEGEDGDADAGDQTMEEQ
ncbi:general transcriptional corepressor trfA [Musca domestica]|uniref:General transcriptional corepressor trfA n=1 Tax=Musca domestica TaxID=7370 RepID=A0A9J7I3Y0_MUSDO|nr:general transcriptional corepressor trfA [Musca domestica]